MASLRQQNPQTNNNFPTFWVMIMGVLIAVGPLAIDMYLPALPSMAEDFSTNTNDIARSVPAYFTGLVVGQLFYGPLSDKIGRIKPMYLGMVIFIVASVLCATAQNEWVLFMARTIQALGACVTGVVTRAAIRDTLNPIGSARAFSLMVLVMGLAPILAPYLGSLMLKVGNWRMIFYFLAGYGILNLLLTKLFLKETLPPQNRNTTPLSHTLLEYVALLKDTRFLLPAVAGGLLQGSFFIYLSISSELFMENFHLTADQFAIAFGANAFGFVAMTQFNQFLTKYYRLVVLLRIGAMIQLVFASLLMVVGLMLGNNAPFLLVWLCIFSCVAGLGLTQPNAGAIALAHQKKRAGMASAMQGSLQFSVGIFGGLLLSLVPSIPVIKLGIILTILMGIGTLLVYQIDPKLDLSQMD